MITGSGLNMIGTPPALTPQHLLVQPSTSSGAIYCPYDSDLIIKFEDDASCEGLINDESWRRNWIRSLIHSRWININLRPKCKDRVLEQC